jgi:hypothetical protein
MSGIWPAEKLISQGGQAIDLCRTPLWRAGCGGGVLRMAGTRKAHGRVRREAGEVEADNERRPACGPAFAGRPAVSVGAP